MGKIDFGNTDFNNVDFDSLKIDEESANFFAFDDIAIPDPDIEKLFDASQEEEDSVVINTTDVNLPSLQEQSERDYIKIANNIVSASIKQMRSQNNSKTILKTAFSRFFIRFITAQYIAMILIFAVQMLFPVTALPTEVLIVYISSVFVETLGAIVLMIKYAFDSGQETQVLDILNGVIANYQKFNDGKETVLTKEETKQKNKTK